MERGEITGAASRAWGRTRSNLRRAARAVRHAGPGRLPAAVVDVETTTTELRLSGWAGAHKPRVASLVVAVDGVPRATAELGPVVPPGGPGHPGDRTWTARIDLDAVGVGRHSTTLLVDDGRGLATSVPGPEVEVSPPVLGALDQPTTGETVGDVVVVRGWVRTALGVDHVEVRMDDHPPVRARLYAGARPDLGAVLADADAPLAAWEAFVPVRGSERWTPPGLAADAHADEPATQDVRTVVATAVGPRNRRHELGRVDVVHEAPRRPVADLARAQVVAARTRLAGRRHTPRTSGEHLLVITHHLGLGGGQLYLQELLRRLLAQDDVTCTVVAPTDGPLRTELEELGARVLVVGRAPVTAVAYEDWMHLLTSAAATTGATSALVNTAGCYWGVDLADRLGIPSVWSVHESFRPEHFVLVGFPAPPDAWVVERFTSAFALAGRVVFEADATMDLFTHLIRDDRALRVDYGIDVDAVQAFVDTHDRDAVRAQLGLGPDETVILCMGTYEPRKAQGLLARAFSELVTDHPRAVLVMVGDQDNEYSRAVHEVVERLGIEERVRMLPVTPLVDEWYLAADCLVLASDIESLSRAMLEAMAFGTPVLVSAVYGHRAVIEDGVNGFLLDSSSVAAVTAALRRILRLERAERAAVGERGRDWVRETRRSEGYAGAYRALIAELHAEQARVGEAS